MRGVAWGRVRRFYEGTAPEVRASRDTDSIRVERLAQRFDVHPRTLGDRALADGWTRPEWYNPYPGQRAHVDAPRLMAERAQRLLDHLSGVAREGAACPTNRTLGERLGYSTNAVINGLRQLVADGRIRVQRRACVRRILVVALDARTGWTTTARPMAAMAETPVQYGADVGSKLWARRHKIHTELRAAAETGAACPSLFMLKNAADCCNRTVKQDIAIMVAEGHFRFENRALVVRRAVFPDGKTTGWTKTTNQKAGKGHRSRLNPQAQRPSRSPAAPALGKMGRISAHVRPPVAGTRIAQVQRALQRHGVVVFDTFVVNGGPPGKSWCVDNRVVDAAGLLAEAAKRGVAA